MKYPEIANRITQILNIRGLKAQDLVEKTGINKSSISQYVNGNHCPSNDKAQLMADVLKVNPLWLMGFDVEMESSINEEKEREEKFIQLYHALDENQRQVVDNMLTVLTSKQGTDPASQQ